MAKLEIVGGMTFFRILEDGAPVDVRTDPRFLHLYKDTTENVPYGCKVVGLSGFEPGQPFPVITLANGVVSPENPPYWFTWSRSWDHLQELVKDHSSDL